MINSKKIVVVMPAYNAEATLRKTYQELDLNIVDDVILVDDLSKDQTKVLAKSLNLDVIVHHTNLGYGGNQKTCYQAALQKGADIVVMLHPDYQYSPKLVTAMASMIAYDEYDFVLGSRILGGTALKGGMPYYKYLSNRLLTLFQNLLMGQKISEYHTGFRAFSKAVLEELPLGNCNDDFIFDNEMIALALKHKFKVGEISCPTKYFPEASSINFFRSSVYGLGVLKVSFLYFLYRSGLYTAKLFKDSPQGVRDLPSRGEIFHKRS